MPPLSLSLPSEKKVANDRQSPRIVKHWPPSQCDPLSNASAPLSRHSFIRCQMEPPWNCQLFPQISPDDVTKVVSIQKLQKRIFPAKVKWKCQIPDQTLFFFKLFTKIVIWRGITTMSQCCQKCLKMQLIAIQFCDQFWSSCNIWHYLSLLHLATKKPRNLASHQWCRTYAAVSLYLDFCFLCTVWAGK